MADSEIGRGPDNPVRQNQMLKVSQLTDIPEDLLAKTDKRVLELSVQDLEDLARRLQGVPTHNPAIEKLTFDDMQSIEDIFAGYKQAKFEELSRQGKGVGDLQEARAFCNKTCCCCTPCCCCAAAETDPVAH